MALDARLILHVKIMSIGREIVNVSVNCTLIFIKIITLS